MNIHEIPDAKFGASVVRGAGVGGDIQFANKWLFECYDTRDLIAELKKRDPNWRQRGNAIDVGLELGFIKNAEELLKWQEGFNNLVVNVGLDEILDKFWKGSAYTAAHYVGLLSGAASPIVFAAGDTDTVHAGWTEETGYSEGTREVLTLGTVASQSVDNSASKASFSITGTATIDGGFVSTDSVKGGSSPEKILIAAGSFTGGPKSVDNGDTLNVTVTLTASSA